jgi:hypothetical protein
MSDLRRYIQTRKYHFGNMILGYGDKNVPLKIARIYYKIATDRADAAIKVSAMDREWAEMVAGRECSVLEILEIKDEMNNWIDLNERLVA